MKRNKIIHKSIIAMLIISAISCLASASWAASYYVDATSGNDSNTGTQSAPWQTVSKINSVGFAAGDTIYFKSGGNWTGTLTPRSSGNSNSAVTYTFYGSGNKPVISSCSITSKSYISIIGLKFNSPNTTAVYIGNSSYIIISNCEVYNTSTNSATYSAFNVVDSSHNKILNCTVSNLNTTGQNDAFDLQRSSYNLIQGNTFLNATHGNFLVWATDSSHPNATANYNVIKNNTFYNAVASEVQFMAGADWNVFEGNLLYGTATHPFSNLAHMIKLVTSHNIVRNNIFRDNPTTNTDGIGAVPYQYGSDPTNQCLYNHIYNNVLTNIYDNPILLYTNAPGLGSVYGNIFKNNISYNNGVSNTYQLMVNYQTDVHDNYFVNNVFYDAGATNVLRIANVGVSIATAQASYPSAYYLNYYSKNLNVNPNLDSNYKPKAGSAVIDAGDFLTTITSSSGSGTSFTVADAGYFTNGFGVDTGDSIQIGSQVRLITNINYSTNTITVDSSVTWTQNQGVALPYSGSKPDIGAFEYDLTTLSPPTNLQVN